MNDAMKAITIWQPWASLIVAGAKPYEFRSWRPPEKLIGQRIVIHAAAKKIDLQITKLALECLQKDPVKLNIGMLNAEKALPLLQAAIDRDIIHGCGLGTAILGESRLRSEIGAEMGVRHTFYGEGIFWGWPMLDVEIWEDPIPMAGMQRFWKWPTPGDFSL